MPLPEALVEVVLWGLKVICKQILPDIRDSLEAHRRKVDSYMASRIGAANARKVSAFMFEPLENTIEYLIIMTMDPVSRQKIVDLFKDFQKTHARAQEYLKHGQAFVLVRALTGVEVSWLSNDGKPSLPDLAHYSETMSSAIEWHYQPVLIGLIRNASLDTRGIDLMMEQCREWGVWRR